jgi:uncharacterized protein with NAD-binding domain and iron-sulfur cluster
VIGRPARGEDVERTSTPSKVAVLGGGVGSIATAFELTATPELRERFDVTVYQLGWRLGGKGASGRNLRQGGRIEEHGLHIWFGFYDNAFRMMREAYEELARPPAVPLATLGDAFHRCDQVVLYDRQGDGWHSFALNAPRNFDRPGVPGPLPSFWEMGATACRWALGRWVELREIRPELDLGEPPGRFTPGWFSDLAADVAADLIQVELAGAEHLLALAERLAGVRARHTDLSDAKHAAHQGFFVRLLTGFRDWLWISVVADRCDDDPDLRLFFTIFDTIASTAAGIVRDGVLERGFDVINDQEWCEWLARHGAHEVTLGRNPAERSPLLRSVYDVAFGYLDGDIDQANVAAGTAINDLLRLAFTYRGSLMYKMQAGMGDTVFAPFYEVLRARGVRFRFFSAVTKLGLSADRRSVDAIDVVSQVEMAAGDYEPLVSVNDLPCWPSEPLWEQLRDGEALRKAGVDFEAEMDPLSRGTARLRRGVDFDQVVLGIPVGALPPICGELIEGNVAFRRMVESSRTVQTQAFQVWMREPTASLGWAHDSNSVAGCYVEPLDTYCDMSHLLPREAWPPAAGVRSVAYFCGVLDERHGETEAEANERAKANAIDFLSKDIGTLWPNAVTDGPRSALRWDLLVDTDDRQGPARFDAQYWRANVSLSERYVLTPAGSVEHRLRSDRSGFNNLVLAGDWTKNGVDGGCVEAAVTSGIQAARGLTGIERPIVGESPTWLRPPPAGLSRYVEFGGRATSPGPFRCTGGRLRCLLLRGDPERISYLMRRTLSDPAGGRIEYRSLGDRVLLMVGSFDSVSSLTAPFDRWGSVHEACASLWVPVVAGRDRGPVFVAERLCLALPYVLVDNPMSYLGGREDYGYAKTMARFDTEGGNGDSVRVSAYGGNFGADQHADWRPLLEIAPVGGQPDDRDARSGAEELVRCLAPTLLDGHAGGDLMLPGLHLTGQLMDETLQGRCQQVFLKQFRDAADGTRACYQSVVETPVQITRVSIRPSAGEWAVTVHDLDSHPLRAELGVVSQSASLAFDLDVDFVLEDGVEIAPISASPQAAQPPSPSNGAASSLASVLSLVESAVGRVYRALPLLGGRRWW